MLIGHIPAGYLATSAVLRRRQLGRDVRRRLMLLGLAASVAPDVDLLWFFLVDHRRHDHMRICRIYRSR